MTQRILVVEDDRALARILRDPLTFGGFEVDYAPDARSARAKLDEFAPHLVLLDITLPGESGFELCRAIRLVGRTPIVILTARREKADKLRGLQLGADDYITKPFDIEELLARIHAVLRRAQPGEAVVSLALGSVTIDFQNRRVSNGPSTTYLSPREVALLRYLAERRDRVVPRNELLREVWGYPELPYTRSVDHAIARLRKKIEANPHRPRFIHTAYGGGYCLTSNPTPGPFPT